MKDSNDLKPEDLLTMLENMQAELEEKQKANFEALTNISKLSSENSTLRNELQKKSDKIVTLNAKLKDQCLVEGDRAKSEEAMAEARKARSEAEQIRAALEGKEEELDNREAEIQRQELELSQEIEKEAEILTEGLRHDLEAEFKRKEDHIWQMSLKREHATADKYKRLTIRYQIEFTIILFYGVIVTALKVIATPEIMTDAIQFFVSLWNTLVGFVVDVISFGHTVAGISQLIPNPTVAGIVFWVLQILITVIAIGIVFLTIYSLIITYVRYMKAKQFDRYTVIVAITVLSVTVFLAGVIKGITSINLFALQISLFLICSGIRAWGLRRRCCCSSCPSTPYRFQNNYRSQMLSCVPQGTFSSQGCR